MALEEYRKKRNFKRTPEPSGRVGYRKAKKPLEYVIQKHDASHLHYDFRLELDGVLKSWAVPKGPSMKPGVRRLAMQTEDHPMDYGDFEGVIPEGQYGGGTVMLWDRGTWTPLGDAAKDYRKGRLRFRLDGEKLAGEWILTRMKRRPGEKKDSWLLIKAGDAAARDEDESDITDEAPRSVQTGRDLDAIARAQDRVWDSNASSNARSPSMAKGPGVTVERNAKLPARVKPQLATLVGEAPEGGDWLHEIKFDGYRVLCRVEGGEARVITRNGKDWTDRFGGVAAAVAALPVEDALVDGEVVVLDRSGVSSFQKLQNSLSGARAGELVLFAFDLLHLDGRDITGAPIEERKALLRQRVGTLGDDRVRYSDDVRGRGTAFFERACGMGLEGIVSKRMGAPYRPGRNKDWLKTKCTARQELVVVGYTEPSGSRVGIGALLLGVHDREGALVYAGKVGTGFDNRTLKRLKARLSGMERKTPPVQSPPRGAEARGVHWVRAELVAEIEFTEWTEDGKVRHPSFQGLREDKAARDVVRESGARGGRTAKPTRSGRVAGGTTAGRERVAGVRITSPDKVLWPEQGVTKGELVAYYEAVADAIVPALRDRPLTLVRCPSGTESKCFFQKHAQDTIPDVVPRVPVEEKGGTGVYMYVNGLPSLVALVQLGVLEFHVWGSRRDRLDRPDRLVFDLDPDEALPFGRVASAALQLREMLAELGLESFPKSTGGKGLHVVVPVTRRSDFDEARAFTQAVAERLVAADPDGFTTKMTKSRRSGRIFIDYLRNAYNATAIGEFSTRARPGAPVAVPLSWEEVDTDATKPPVHTIRDVPERLAEGGDPWAGYDDVRQSITIAMLKGLGLR